MCFVIVAGRDSSAPAAICKKEALDTRAWFTDVLGNGKVHEAELLVVLLWQV